MIGLEVLYVIAGALFAAVAVFSTTDASNPRRRQNTAFWCLFAAVFLLGSHISDLANGALALALVGVGGIERWRGGTVVATTVEQRKDSALLFGNRLFLLALVIPFTALAGTILFKSLSIGGVHPVDPKQATLVALILGVILSLALALPLLRAKPVQPLQEGRRLFDQVGWAIILPQLLASLGAVFAAAGVGTVLGGLIGGWLPEGSRIAAVLAYTLGMAMFTVVMGNAFAAFPVMTAAVGLPLLIGKLGGDPAVVGAIGMLSGFCGTLLTPMAANFNMVPAALLELKDRNGVIKAQTPTALALLIVNSVLMYVLAFR